MKILILGAKGLVGTSLVPKLKNHEVLALDRVYDIRSDLVLPRVDMIINLASLNDTKESTDKPEEYCRTNVIGNFNMLEAARQMKAKYLYLSTVKMDETTPYGASKKCAHAWNLAYKHTYKIPMVMNVVGNLYGPGGHNSWVNKFMEKCKKGEQIEVWGDGSATRDMLYIEDLTDLLVDQIENFFMYEKCDEIPVGGGGNMLSIKELVEWLKYDNVTYKDALGTTNEPIVPDNTLVSLIHGWKPTTSLEEGLKKTYESI